MKYLLRNLLIAFLIFLIISGLFTLLTGPIKKAEEISLSQLVEQINQESVNQIVIKGDELEITMKDGTKKIAAKEKESSLTESLKNYGVDSEKLKLVNLQIKEEGGMMFWLGAILPFLLPFLIIGLFLWFMFRGAQRGQMQAFSFGRSRARLFMPKDEKEKVTFRDVAGLQEAKEELQEIVEFLKNPKKFTQLGAKIPKGVLLVGLPGTGKTLLARAVATEAGVPFFSVAGSEFLELFVGIGSARTRDLFQTAKKNSPCLVFIDELEAIGRQRGIGIGGAHEEREQTLNQILVEMDGFEPNSGVIILGASVTGDTPILIKNENEEIKLMPIADFVDSYYAEDEGGIEKPVFSIQSLGFDKKITKKYANHSLYFGKSAFKSVRGVFRHKVNEIYEIEYLGGKIRATGNHSVFVRTRHGIEAKLVVDLSPGDILVDIPYKVNRTSFNKLRETRHHCFPEKFSLRLPVYQINQEWEDKYLFAITHMGKLSQSQIAAYVGVSQTDISKWHRGIYTPRKISRNYFKHTLPETIEVTPALMRLMGYYVAEGYSRKEIDFCIGEKENYINNDIQNLMYQNFGLKPDRIRNITTNAVNIIYYTRPLAQFFTKYCGKGAANKHVPSFLFEAPKEYFVEFLRGCFNGDGYEYKQGKGEITSVSKQLILELNWLCRMHGIKSYVGSFTTIEGRKIRGGKPLKATLAYRLGLGNSNNPFSHKSIRNTSCAKRPIIKSIKKLPYNGYVYDLCGCENEAFFGGKNPILLHNSNRPDILDPALLRPGRFDRRIVLDLPDLKDREEILKIHSRGKPLASNTSLREIAERTPGFSGADLANLVNEASILAARRNKVKIEQDELRDCIEKVLLGPERKSHILSKQEKEIAAYHEAGHALVNASLPHTDPIQKVSIIARGLAAGYTLKLPVEDRHLHSRSEFIDELAVLMGGYVTEKLVFNEITTGAASDLQKASDLARRLVTQYGMSEKLGPMTYGEQEELIFLGREITTEKNYSEEVAAQIDKEVAKFIDDAYHTAKKILTEKRKKLDQIAKQLIKKETIERKEFERLMKKD